MNPKNPRGSAPRVREIDELIAMSVLVLTLVLAGVYWFLEYQPYILANSDFFRIQSMAQLFAALEVPEDFKQMPLVPLLMVPLATLLPVSADPYLHALSVINIALSLGSLVLLYFLGRQFLGPVVALIPVFVLLAIPQFTVSAHQPMLEPSIGFFSLATLLAIAHRSNWAYVLAGLAALTRYELAILLPVVFAIHVLRVPGALFRAGLLAGIASTPFVIWFGLSVLLSPEGNPYFGDIVRASFLDVAKNMVSPFPGRHFALIFLLVAWTIGLVTAFRRNREVTLAILLFFGLYLLAHFVYGRPLSRYSYPVQWVVPLLAVIGFRELLVWMGSKTRMVPGWLSILMALGLAAVASMLWWRAAASVTARIPMYPINTEAWYVGWSTLWGALIVVTVVMAARAARWQATVAAALVASLVFPPLVLGGGSLAGRMLNVHYDKAELVLAQKWLSEHLEPGAVAVMSRYHSLHDRMPTIRPDQRVAYGSFDADTHAAFVEELDQRGIEYVIFLHRPERPTDESHPLYGRNISNYLRGKIYLMEPFRNGEDVYGFERLTTLSAPHPTGHETHIYRRDASANAIREQHDD